MEVKEEKKIGHEWGGNCVDEEGELIHKVGGEK